MTNTRKNHIADSIIFLATDKSPRFQNLNPDVTRATKRATIIHVKDMPAFLLTLSSPPESPRDGHLKVFSILQSQVERL